MLIEIFTCACTCTCRIIVLLFSSHAISTTGTPTASPSVTRRNIPAYPPPSLHAQQGTDRKVCAVDHVVCTYMYVYSYGEYIWHKSMLAKPMSTYYCMCAGENRDQVTLGVDYLLGIMEHTPPPILTPTPTHTTHSHAHTHTHTHTTLTGGSSL